MRRNDLTPLLHATIGFDRMMNLLDSVPRTDEGALSYPPYNIEKTGEDTYGIVMAVAGFAEDELDITVKENSLLVTGKKEKPAADPEAERTTYLHQGIATRSFERRFDLADYIKVTGARLENGLLSIDLEREIPEAMKPRTIAIEAQTPGKQKVIEGKAA